MRKANNLPSSCAVVMKSGNLNFLEPSGSLQACNWTALSLSNVLIEQQMHSGFMDVILLRNHQHVSATHVDICKNTNNICIHVLTTLQMATGLAGTCS